MYRSAMKGMSHITANMTSATRRTNFRFCICTFPIARPAVPRILESNFSTP
uniref:Uncharacterized protein n=1 Tax=Arundo donax TaxID=35708 RepID=A0A0A8Z341_ARUDO